MASATGVQHQRDMTFRERGSLVTTFNNFASRSMYALGCVQQTTLGVEIVEAAIPCARTVLFLAERWEPMAKAVWVFCKYLVPVVVVLQLVSAMQLAPEVEIARVWVVRVVGVSALMYFIPLFFVFLPFIYCPMVSVILPVAMVFRVEDAGEANNNFFDVTVGEQLDVAQARVDLESHVFAARLRQENTVTIMVYEDAWVKRNLDTNLLLFEIGVCTFHFASLVIVRDEPAQRSQFLTTLALLFLSLAVPYVLQWVACVAGTLFWAVLNILLCCLPQYLVEQCRKQVEEYVLRQAKSNAGTQEGTVQATVVGATTGGNQIQGAEDGHGAADDKDRIEDV